MIALESLRFLARGFRFDLLSKSGLLLLLTLFGDFPLFPLDGQIDNFLILLDLGEFPVPMLGLAVLIADAGFFAVTFHSTGIFAEVLVRHPVNALIFKAASVDGFRRPGPF